MKTRVVALVGTATSSRERVRDEDPDSEVWGLNTSYSWMPRWTRWFEVHDRNRVDFITGSHLEWLRTCGVPVYMQAHYEDIPTSVAFPAEAVTRGGQLRPLLTSSIAYMLALAVQEGFEEIHLYGIDMATDSEYAFQRAACEYWIGVAEASGTKVVIPENSPIGKGIRYGRDPSTASASRLLVDWTDKVAAERERKLDEAATEVYMAVDALRTRLNGGRPSLAEVRELAGKAFSEADALRVTMAAYEGARSLLYKMRQEGGV